MTPKAPRPEVVDCVTVKEEVACNDLFTIIGRWDNTIRELFCKLGTAGSCTMAIINALAVVTSICLRSGIPSSVIGKLFAKDLSLCPHSYGMRPTCIVAIGKALLVEGGTGDTEEAIFQTPMKMIGTQRLKVTGCGIIAVQCFDDSDGNLRKVGAELAQTNTCANTITRMIGKLITLALAHEVSIQDIVHGLAGIGCPQANHECSSCIDAIARAIDSHEKAKVPEDEEEPHEQS